jgi:acylphosphatase
LDKITRRFLVLGKVQGVYFRHSSRLEAIRLTIRGHARNLPDGCVEVLAHGAPASVEELRAWLTRGPPEARVDEVRETPPGDAGTFPEDFSIL